MACKEENLFEDQTNGDTEHGEESLPPSPAGPSFPMFGLLHFSRTGTQKKLGTEGRCWQGVERGLCAALGVCRSAA